MIGERLHPVQGAGDDRLSNALVKDVAWHPLGRLKLHALCVIHRLDLEAVSQLKWLQCIVLSRIQRLKDP